MAENLQDQPGPRRAPLEPGRRPPHRGRAMSRARRAVSGVTTALLSVVAAGMVFAAIGPIAGWWHYEVVESGSMVPALPIGSVAVVEREPLGQVRVGQVLAFHPPGMKTYVRIHRVVELTRRGDQVWIRTKGDANNVADPGPVRLQGGPAYHEVMVVPYLGYGAVYLFKHTTRVGLSIALLVVVVGGGLYLIWSGEGESESGAAGERHHLPAPRAPAGTGGPSDGPAAPAPDLSLPGPDEHSAGKAAGTAKVSLLALNSMYKAQPEEHSASTAEEGSHRHRAAGA